MRGAISISHWKWPRIIDEGDVKSPVTILLLSTIAASGAEEGYIDPIACRLCHTRIFDSYQQTGMGRSFNRIARVAPVEDWDRNNRFYHAASERYYEVSRRDGRYFLRRYQKGNVNSIEKEIHYVVGSGNHSRTYLHRSAAGKLVELPLSWYAERGGDRAMSPGYDRPDHQDFRREVSDSCLFCHNGYPSRSNGGLAMGIDCQRCHGPGEAHAAGKGTIVNPAKLTAERQLEVCLQCHLESASRSLPEAVRRFGRSTFSFRPGEPLGDYTIYFDFADQAEREGITVNHSAYGMLRSACYLRSEQRMSCTTCHDPHHAERGEAARRRVNEICGNCHGGPPPGTAHARGADDCVTCHMPQRRTSDAVHVVMTDHHIRRRPPTGDPLAPLRERRNRSLGDVVPVYPARLPDTAENRVYQAVGQLRVSAHLDRDIQRLRRAIENAGVLPAQPFVELADALRRSSRDDDAIIAYRESLDRERQHLPALTGLSELLLARGAAAESAQLIEPILSKDPNNRVLLNALAITYVGLGRFREALKLTERAVAADPDDPLSWLNLGVCRQQQGDLGGAAVAYQTALRLQPDFARAQVFLSRLRSR
jgi:predicted CXXCH cytochrome family protein